MGSEMCIRDRYAPGLVRYGIGAGGLLVVSGLHRQADMLWAMEEALRCRAVRGVVAETGGIGLAAGRRLMLAAEGTGVLGLMLAREGGGKRGGVGVAASRWRVTAVPGGLERAEKDGTRWRVELQHCRGGRPAEWTVVWEDDGYGLSWRSRLPARHISSSAISPSSASRRSR